ncbi:spo12-like protein [Niveomyces insectorum RCEF 264]|uniref:Spo12-like protein n=1 Tax=Niveomyces insectorum RCEF 264 TaxID=1081102 RepID=A0A167ZAV9_9HYPO|nr:spo12-like protein [Niveomyces insectorum RCEF 264]
MDSFTAKSVLADKDVNTALPDSSAAASTKVDIKSMEYHRQVLQSKMGAEGPKQYVSPSDNIMSPCTAKLKALRTKQVGKAKPKSLFAQASARKLMEGGAPLGSTPLDLAPPATTTTTTAGAADE